MRVARLAAVVGVFGLVAGGAATAIPAAPRPAIPASALAGVVVRPGVLHVGRAQAGPLSTADCEQAYRIVQGHAMRAWEEEGDFRAAIEADPEVRAFLTPDRIANAFSVERQLRNVDKIFARVFGSEASS